MNTKPLIDLVFEAGLSKSVSMSRMFVHMGNIKVNGKTVNNVREQVELVPGTVIELAVGNIKKSVKI